MSNARFMSTPRGIWAMRVGRAGVLLAGIGLYAAHCGAQVVSATITTGNAPAALAVNPATNQIYVANRTDNTVTVIDGASGLATATIHDDNAVVPTIATVPTEIAVDTTANQIYVSNWAGCTAPAPGIVEVMQIDGNSLVTTPLGTGGSGPTGIAVNPNTHVAYVSNICDGTLSVLVNGTFSPILANRTGAVMPNSVAINPATNKAYFATYSKGGPGLVIALDGLTNLTTSLSAGKGPTALTVNVATNKIYVANQTDGTVTVIDGATFTVVATVTVGALPMQLGVDPVTDKVYVVNQNGNSVSVIDGATDAVATIPVGNGPDGIGIDSLTDQIYVANGNDNTVSVLDGASGIVTKTLAVGAGPTAIAVNPVTHHVYVANRKTNTVSVIDEAPAPTVAQVAVGKNPRSVALNPLTGQLFVSNQDDGTVTSIGSAPAQATATSAVSATAGSATLVSVLADVNRVAVISAATSGQGKLSILDGASLQPIGATVIPDTPVAASFNDATGYLYVVSGGNATTSGKIWAIDPSTLGVATGVPVGMSPVALAVDPATSQVYVANSAGGSVSALGVNGTTFQSGTTIAVAGQPAAIAANPLTGLVYVASQNGTAAGTLSVIDPSTAKVTATVPVGAVPSAVAVDANTNEIFVANKADGTVTRIDANYGNRTSTIANVGPNPHALAVDTLNDLVYVADDVNGDGLTAAVTIIDAATASAGPQIRTGTYNAALLVNQATGEAYAPDGAGNVYTLTPAAALPNPMSTVITGVADAQTISTAPFETANLAQKFQAAVADSFSGLAAYQSMTGIANPAPQTLYYRLDGATQYWFAATSPSPSGTFSMTTAAAPGLHTLYAFTAYGREGSSQSTGNGSGNSPEIGPIVAVPALVVAAAPAPASAPCASPCVIPTKIGPITISANQGGIGAVQYLNAPPNAPAAIQTPFGYYSFSVGGLTPGASITVSFGVPFGFTLSGYEKCINGTCSPLPGATINNGAPDGPTLSISLIDGGLNDADGAANGTIVDPGALLATGSAAMPGAPTGLGINVASAQVSLSWTAASNTQSYNVYQGTAPNGESTTPVLTSVTGTTAVLGGLTNGTTYYFRVAAVNGTNVSTYSNEVSGVANAMPVQVTGLAATAGDAQVALTWAAAGGASGYTVYSGTTAGGESVLATGVTATSYTATGLTDGTTYYFKVAATNSAGTGPQSVETSAKPTATVTVTASRSGGGALDPLALALLCALLCLRLSKGLAARDEARKPL